MNHTKWFLIQFGFINTRKEYKTKWLRALVIEISCTNATAEKEHILVSCSGN